MYISNDNNTNSYNNNNDSNNNDNSTLKQSSLRICNRTKIIKRISYRTTMIWISTEENTNEKKWQKHKLIMTQIMLAANGKNKIKY